MTVIHNRTEVINPTKSQYMWIGGVHVDREHNEGFWLDSEPEEPIHLQVCKNSQPTNLKDVIIGNIKRPSEGKTMPGQWKPVVTCFELAAWPVMGSRRRFVLKTTKFIDQDKGQHLRIRAAIATKDKTHQHARNSRPTPILSR